MNYYINKMGNRILNPDNVSKKDKMLVNKYLHEELINKYCFPASFVKSANYDYNEDN